MDWKGKASWFSDLMRMLSEFETQIGTLNKLTQQMTSQLEDKRRSAEEGTLQSPLPSGRPIGRVM